MRFPVVYDRASTPTRGPQPGAIALRDWVLANYPDLTSLGIYNNRPVRGGASLSTHAEGRAIDIGTPSETAPTETARATGRVLAALLIEHHAALGVQQIIFDRRLWRNTRASGGWSGYHGTNPHRGHLHIELTRQAARYLTRQQIADTLGGTTVPARPDRTDQIKEWQRKLVHLEYARNWITGNEIEPDDEEMVDQYVDGDFGDQTLADSLALVEDFITHDGDPKVARKVEAADTMAAAYRQLMEATS